MEIFVGCASRFFRPAGRESVISPVYPAMCLDESFEFLLKFDKSSFLRKQESSVFNKFLDSGFHRNDIFGRNSKVSDLMTPEEVLAACIERIKNRHYSLRSKISRCKQRGASIT